MSAWPTKSGSREGRRRERADDVRRRRDHGRCGSWRAASTSRVPVTSVCTSEPARLKYSELVSRWKNFGTVLLRRARASSPSPGAGDRIGLLLVGERKHVHRVLDVEVLQLVARLLAEAMVERAAARAAHLIEDAVEDDAAALVVVEALVDEVAEEAAGLRHAPADGEADARASGCRWRRCACLKKLTRSRVPARPTPTTRGSRAR